MIVKPNGKTAVHDKNDYLTKTIEVKKILIEYSIKL